MQTFRLWKLSLRDEVASASGIPELGFKWIFAVEKANQTFEKLADSKAFPSLDAKLASALSRITTGELARPVNVQKEKLASKGTPMKGRQALLLLYQHFQIGETEGSLLSLQDLLDVRLTNDNLRAFLNDWESVLAVMAKPPEEDVLETLFRRQLFNSQGMKDQMAYYERLEAGRQHKTYDFLVSMVRRHLDTRRRHHAREELHRNFSSGRG